MMLEKTSRAYDRRYSSRIVYGWPADRRRAMRREKEDDITLDRLLVFITVTEQGGYTEAADALGKHASGIREHIKTLKKVYGGRELLIEQNGKLIPTEFGKDVLRKAHRMVNLWRGIARIGDIVTTVAFLPQHAYFMSPVILARVSPLTADKRLTIHKRVLGERERNIDVFQTHVMGPLRGGEIDVVTGPPPQTMEGLHATPLYTSQLEAMWPNGETGAPEAVTVRQLIEKGPLLIPPSRTRSRILLETAARQDMGIEDLRSRIALEAYGTKVLVAFGEDGHGTVVVPSDIARPFKAGNALGGPEAAAFTWIPIVKENGDRLTHQVYATTRKSPGE